MMRTDELVVVEEGKDSLQQMKDDIMENNAYHIIVLNLQRRVGTRTRWQTASSTRRRSTSSSS